MDTVLYQFWRSSASYRVRWALGVKGVPFTTVAVDILRGEQLTAEHLARNPMGHVPALWIDGRCLAESVAILEYLDETRPSPPLYPREPWQRARVRQVVELVNSGIQPLQNLTTQRKRSADPAEQLAWSRFFNERGLTACEALIAAIAAEIPGDGRFCVGDGLTAADLFVVPQLAHGRRMGVDLARCPRLLAIEAHLLTTEHAGAALPERQPGAPAA
jgi:maleylacetoacetate isomerase